MLESLKQRFSTWGSFGIFLGVARASDENIHNYFYTLYFVCGTTFCRNQNIIGSPGKNDLLDFHSKLF